jgi:hypothetical protein
MDMKRQHALWSCAALAALVMAIVTGHMISRPGHGKKEEV